MLERRGGAQRLDMKKGICKADDGSRKGGPREKSVAIQLNGRRAGFREEQEKGSPKKKARGGVSLMGTTVPKNK